MKKKWLLLSGLLVIAASIYFLIPAHLTISKAIRSKGSIAAANRYFLDTSKWSAWWPANGYIYKVTGVFYNEVHLSMQSVADSNIDAIMRIAQLSRDSILIGIESKVTGRGHGKEIRETIGGILDAFGAFLGDNKKIYGVNMEHTFSKDSILVTLSGFTTAYPTTGYIYQMLDTVKRYVGSQDAKAISFPLLNVERSANNRFRTMVAISVDKRIAGSGRIVVKRFVPWKMIEGEVHGGVYSVDKAMEQLFKFRDDYQLSIMSIPFQSLITDRSKESDTTKWITRVCAPIS